MRAGPTRRRSTPWRDSGRFAAGAGLVAALVLMPLSGTQAADSPAPAADDLTFTIGMTNEVDSFNPFNGIESESYEMWALMYDYMISYSDTDMSPEPALAESWDTADDGLTWTFHIRTGVKWSDGEDLTAADIAYTYNRILDGGPEAGSWGSYLTDVETIEAPDDETVVMTLSKPNAVLPLLPMPIVPEHIWKNVPEKGEGGVKTYANEPSSGKPVVGSGAFRLVEGKAGGQTYRFEANPDYWKGTPKISEVVFRVYRSEDTLVQALKAGETDFASGMSPLQVQALESDPSIEAHLGSSPGFSEIAFNTGSIDIDTGKPMGDPNPAVMNRDFRFALNFAIDREALVDRVYQQAASVGTTIIPPAYSQYRWEPDDEDAFTYDPDKAKELLDEAGFTVGPDGWRTMPDGTPIGKLRLHARSDSDLDASVNTMSFFKEWLADIDIDSEVISVESTKLTGIILDGDFDIFQWGWFVEPDPNSMLSYFTCDQRGNWSDSWYCSDTYDRMFADQSTATDQDTRIDIVKQMQEELYDQAPYLVTVYDKIGEAYRKDRWEGFEPQPADGGIWLFQYGIANYLRLQPAGTAAAEGGSVATDGSDKALSSGQIIALGVTGIVLFLVGGTVGGFAGYRKATVDYRE